MNSPNFVSANDRKCQSGWRNRFVRQLISVVHILWTRRIKINRFAVGHLKWNETSGHWLTEEGCGNWIGMKYHGGLAKRILLIPSTRNHLMNFITTYIHDQWLQFLLNCQWIAPRFPTITTLSGCSLPPTLCYQFSSPTFLLSTWSV